MRVQTMSVPVQTLAVVCASAGAGGVVYYLFNQDESLEEMVPILFTEIAMRFLVLDKNVGDGENAVFSRFLDAVADQAVMRGASSARFQRLQLQRLLLQPRQNGLRRLGTAYDALVADRRTGAGGAVLLDDHEVPVSTGREVQHHFHSTITSHLVLVPMKILHRVRICKHEDMIYIKTENLYCST